MRALLTIYGGAALLPLASAAPSALSCPCIEWAGLDAYRQQINGKRCVAYAPGSGFLSAPPSSGQQAFCYPLDYGSTQCKQWDAELQPTCADAAGNPLPDAPSWCLDSWCYVDPADCDIEHGATRSGMFEGVYYSYSTCGSSNSFADYVGNAGKPLAELLEVMEEYVFSTVDVIETAWAEAAESTNPDYCTIPDSCNCEGCLKSRPSWGCDVSLDFTEANIVYGCGTGASGEVTCVDQTDPAAVRATCMGRDVSAQFQRVAAKEYNDRDRVAGQYFGDQKKGTLLFWPEQEFCGNDGRGPNYDPRFRPWYSAAASGPKDVVIVIDTSGSMDTAGRIDKALHAAIAVVDTLTWVDYANVVLFDSNAIAYTGSGLVQMTADNKASVIEWLKDHVYPSGATNFRSGYDAAFSVLNSASKDCSGCNTAILFMTDGIDEGWGPDDEAWLAGEKDRRGCLTVMTYSFGEGVKAEAKAKLKRMACQNDGIYHEVSDGGNLRDTMASYFTFFASGVPAQQVRYVLYNDAVTGKELLAACSAAFDRSLSPPDLIGVTCTDLNMIVSVDDLKAQPSWTTLIDRVADDAAKCPELAFSNADLEELRRRVSPASVCGAMAPFEEPAFVCAQDSACSATSANSAFSTTPPPPPPACKDVECELDNADCLAKKAEELLNVAKGNPVRAIAGAVGGVVFFGFVWYVFCRKKKVVVQPSKPPQQQQQQQQQQPQVVVLQQPQTVMVQQPVIMQAQPQYVVQPVQAQTVQVVQAQAAPAYGAPPVYSAQ